MQMESRTPEPGQWPCQRPPDPGQIEEHAIAVGVHSTGEDDVTYVNVHIEGYARALATYLLK